MFTGIIEETGKIKKVVQENKSARLTIQAKEILEDLKVGDSISVDGVCLTAVSFGKDSFEVDVSPETFKNTNLGNVKSGYRVNLERAMKVSGRLGGHIVSGHIDGVGRILDKKKAGNAVLITISYPSEITDCLILRGSIAIDGISLTMVEVNKESIKVSIIPHTLSATTLNSKQVGNTVNLEADLIAKYVKNMVLKGNLKEGKETQDISYDFLAEHGFL